MKTTAQDRETVRIAVSVREQLHERQARQNAFARRQLAELVSTLHEFRAVERRLGICVGRHWDSAARRLVRQTERLLADLPYRARRLEEAVTACEGAVPKLRDIVAEITATEEEFGELGYDRRTGHLSVTTDPVELNGVYLGPFEIRLSIPDLAHPDEYLLYRVIAQDPNPAVSNEGVTHPHVSAERLCPGDAAGPIRAALEAGRLCDFFTLVRSVLATYNPDSPYVRLEDWEGQPCYDCGCIAVGDGLFWCRVCERDFCEECCSYCRGCEETVCLSDLDRCPVCDESFCPSCLTTCPGCGSLICQGCLEENQCPCTEEDEEVDDEHDQAKGPSGDILHAGAGVQEGTA